MSAINTLHVHRKFNPARDMVPHDYRQDRSKWVVAFHTWATGQQELVFESIQKAENWARSQGFDFICHLKDSK